MDILSTSQQDILYNDPCSVPTTNTKLRFSEIKLFQEKRKRKNCRFVTYLYQYALNGIPLQAWRDPEVSRRLRLADFKTIGTCR